MDINKRDQIISVIYVYIEYKHNEDCAVGPHCSTTDNNTYHIWNTKPRQKYKIWHNNNVIVVTRNINQIELTSHGRAIGCLQSLFVGKLYYCITKLSMIHTIKMIN